MFSDAVSEDALDLVGTHGYFCALNNQPSKIAEKQWLQELFDGIPDYSTEDQKARIEDLLRRFYFSIGSDLYNDQDMLLPCDLTLETEDDEDEQSAMTSWAQALWKLFSLKKMSGLTTRQKKR